MSRRTLALLLLTSALTACSTQGFRDPRTVSREINPETGELYEQHALQVTPGTDVSAETGIGAAAGGLGGVFVQIMAGRLEDFYRTTNSGDVAPAYAIMFGVCAFAYLVAWLFMKVLVPKYKPIVE